MTNNTVQPCHVYGLPNRASLPTMTIAETFAFGFNQANQGMGAIYMGPHVATFEAGCKFGQQTREAREQAEAAQKQADAALEHAARLNDHFEGLICCIKQLRAELKEARTNSVIKPGTRVYGRYNHLTGTVADPAFVTVCWDRTSGVHPVEASGLERL